MKKTYLISTIVLFIILMIPYFENIQINPFIMFFGKQRGFLNIYLPILFLGIILGGLILLTIQGYITDIKKSTPKKFDLNN